MGLNDRDYARDSEAGFHLSAPQSMVGGLLLVTIAVWLLDVFIDGRISDACDLSAELVRRPWNVWQLVTYGFLHDIHGISHILTNMVALYIFGRELESMYGKWEFFRFYLIAIALGGLTFVLWRNFAVGEPQAHLVGASAAIAAVVVLFTLHFPRQTVLIWGIMPVPVWLIGGMLVVGNMFGMANSPRGDPVAYEAHVAGILLALGYYRFQWNFGALLPGSGRGFSFPRPFRARPKLKVHAPTDEPVPATLSAETDRILAKIHATGYDSLSDDERRTLERASARARAHKRGP